MLRDEKPIECNLMDAHRILNVVKNRKGELLKPISKDQRLKFLVLEAEREIAEEHNFSMTVPEEFMKLVLLKHLRKRNKKNKGKFVLYNQIV